jgi:polyhydroxybutyrate depolymerase
VSAAAAFPAISLAAILAACAPRVDRATFIDPASGRPYTVFSPRGHEAGGPSPALFVLHAYATDPEVLVRAYALERRAVADRGWTLVVPEGVRDAEGKRAWNASAACCGTGPDRPDDVGYLRRVLAQVRGRVAVDAARVFAIGESNGAFMAHRWACAGGGDLRAIAGIAGAAPGPDDPRCAPAVPVSVLLIHGDSDPLIRFEGGRSGGGRYPAARDSAQTWRRLDSCDPAPRTTVEWRLFLGRSRVESWSCPGASVALWTVEGGAHHMRGLRFAAEAILDFLAASTN